MLRVLVISLNLVFLIIGTGCELPHATQPSILVVAVEGLNFNRLSCDSEEIGDRAYDGIRALCEEGVRFSHAFAPSTMSQATMASLLTGLHPFDHGVHHNGSDFLSARFRTLGEGALAKGYHTLFISGGAPIWRKSGLAQGFEVFDDSVEIGLGSYYRPAEEVVRLALNWLQNDAGSSPFLAVLYFNDLQFPQFPTRTGEGELREISGDAQVEEVAEGVQTLTKWLKKNRRWNSTNVVLVGLNSIERQETDTEPSPLNLKSSGVQVSLFIKPARKESDNVIQWAVDKNVSLVDVGKTMFEWLGLETTPSTISAVEPQSLIQAVTRSAPNWKENRLIVSETSWPDWMEQAGRRVAIRQNHLLYVEDERPLIYNTLTDRLEAVSLRQSDPLWTSLNTEVLSLLKKMKSPPWKGMSPQWADQIEVARELWIDNTPTRVPVGKEAWSKWYLRRALQNRDWREVKRLALEAGDALGIYVASRHLGENYPVPKNPCVKMVLASDAQASECQDERLHAVHTWQTAKSEEEKSSALERFHRIYSLHLLDQQIGRLNFLTDLRWDVARDIPGRPQAVDYIMTLKEFEPLAKRSSSLLSYKDVTF